MNMHNILVHEFGTMEKYTFSQTIWGILAMLFHPIMSLQMVRLGVHLCLKNNIHPKTILGERYSLNRYPLNKIVSDGKYYSCNHAFDKPALFSMTFVKESGDEITLKNIDGNICSKCGAGEVDTKSLEDRMGVSE